jgi:hypothetical protein
MRLLQLFNDRFLSGDAAILGPDAASFLLRIAFDLATVFAIVRGIYRRQPHRSELQFTLFSMNLVIFLVSYLLNAVEMTMGAAFGLFAVFSMLRYRTENISARDMTYVFIAIAVGLLTAVSGGGWLELALVCVVVVGGIWLLESGRLLEREQVQQVVYDRMDLIPPEKRTELVEDLRARTGLAITRVEVGHIDLVKDTVHLSVYHR